MAGSIVGPTLLDLACHTNSKLENMSYIFTSRSVGYLTGSMVGGWLYDKFNKLRLLSLSCLVATVFMWVSPLTTNLYVLMVFMTAINLAEGCLDTGENQSAARFILALYEFVTYPTLTCIDKFDQLDKKILF